MTKEETLPKNARIRRKMAQALRRGGSGRTKRLRKKKEQGFGMWFYLHVSNGGFLP